MKCSSVDVGSYLGNFRYICVVILFSFCVPSSGVPYQVDHHFETFLTYSIRIVFPASGQGLVGPSFFGRHWNLSEKVVPMIVEHVYMIDIYIYKPSREPTYPT